MYLDIAVGIILLLTILRGYSNGFFLSAISLFGIVINVVAAKIATARVIDTFNIAREGSNYLLFYGGIFLGIYLFIGLLLTFLKSFVKNNVRNFMDTLLGVIFGFVKGAALSFMVLLFFNLAGNHFQEIKRYGEDSKTNIVFKRVVPYLRNYFPESIGNRIESQKYRENVEKYLEDVLKETE